MKTKLYYLPLLHCDVVGKPFSGKGKTKFAWFFKITFFCAIMLQFSTFLQAQSVAGSTWDLATTVSGSGYTNWGSGVITLTDTTSGSGCRGSAVIETDGYNPATNFSQCYKVFFGCPGNDVIGTLASPYTDQNADGLAFSFWKNNATYSATNGNTCGGGLGYDNALTGGDNDGKMITIEFDTYSSLGTSTVDNYYGGGAPGSGSIDDEISLHKDQNSNDLGLFTTTTTTNLNAGNLEDGLQHDVCITYNASTHVLGVTLDGNTMLAYDMDAVGLDLVSYFGSGKTLNYSWSAGEFGSTNFQTIGPAGSNLFAVIGHNPCTHAVVMPVSLLSFSGALVNESVLLNWSTADETNNAKFEIERSGNGKNWQTIGEVAGSGNSASILNYSFTDQNPLMGDAYYRLQQVDLNGASVNSNAVLIQKEEAKSASISPNPFENVLTIKTNIKDDLEIYIYDVLGRLMYQSSAKSDNGILHFQPEINNGSYLVTIQAGEFVEHQRVIKK